MADRVRKFFRSIMDGVKHVGQHVSMSVLGGQDLPSLLTLTPVQDFLGPARVLTRPHWIKQSPAPDHGPFRVRVLPWCSPQPR